MVPQGTPKPPPGAGGGFCLRLHPEGAGGGAQSLAEALDHQGMAA